MLWHVTHQSSPIFWSKTCLLGPARTSTLKQGVTQKFHNFDIYICGVQVEVQERCFIETIEMAQNEEMKSLILENYKMRKKW